jgi:hypothetical protein
MTHNEEPICCSTPWTIRMDRNGTEDIASICDSFGFEIVRSRAFWRPTEDHIRSETWDAVRLMHAAPRLYHALLATLTALRELQPEHELCAKAHTVLISVTATPEVVDLLNSRDVHDELAERMAIASIWDYSDVLSVRPDLTKAQAWRVLQATEKHHDANIGINWEVLEFHAQFLFGDAPESATGTEG